MDTVKIFINLFIAIAAGGLAGSAAIYVFNRMPAKWLCDYGQDPGKEMWGVRIRKKPWAAVFILVFAASALKLLEQGILYTIPGIIALWLLLLIAIADWKYMIIPDQFVIALVVTAIGFIPFHAGWQSQLTGALAGGGCLLLMGIVGRLLFHKEAMGFGDVKLFAAIGLLLGLKGVVIVLILTVFSSAFVFGIGLMIKRLKAGDAKPFGPFIAASSALYILFTFEFQTMADWYLSR